MVPGYPLELVQGLCRIDEVVVSEERTDESLVRTAVELLRCPSEREYVLVVREIAGD